MSHLEDTISECIALDTDVLGQGQREADAAELVRMHLLLAQQLEETTEEAINALAISEELRKQILSEKQLLSVFASKGDQEMVTFLTTFTCFLCSQENGEPMHSRKYMEDVRRLHEVVNIHYGVDPGTAGVAANHTGKIRSASPAVMAFMRQNCL